MPRPWVALVVAAMLLPALSGCVLAKEPLIVALSAPRAASGMTVFLVTENGYLDKFREVKAEYAVYYGDKLIFPPAGKGAELQMDGRTGSAFVSYDRFVVGNGEYDVIVHYGSSAARARVHVEKWANYVFLHPFDKGDHVTVEAALQSGTGGNPDDRVLSAGQLVLTLVYHGLNGDQSRTITQMTVETHHDTTSTSVDVPKAKFSAGPGYYSFEPLFHNDEALDNLQVGPDPTMANQQPPWNWIQITT